MFQRILVPTDGRATANNAITSAELIARALHGRLTILRVLPRGASGDGEDAQALSQTQRLKERLAAAGVDAETALREGEPSDEILIEAAPDRTDLIVMATHGRAGLSRVVLGSVTEEIVAKSQVPVLLVGPETWPLQALKTLLVPVDESPGSALGLNVAVALAKATGARLVLAQVVVPLSLYAYAAFTETPTAYVDPAWETQSLESAEHYVSGLARSIAAMGVSTVPVVKFGSVSTSLTEVAEEHQADLVVMGTHAFVGAPRAALGSVADEMVRKSGRPVLLVRYAPPDKPAP